MSETVQDRLAAVNFDGIQYVRTMADDQISASVDRRPADDLPPLGYLPPIGSAPMHVEGDHKKIDLSPSTLHRVAERGKI